MIRNLKNVVCLLLVALLVVTLWVPFVQKSLGEADTLTVDVSLPLEHAGHTPLQDPGFWVNYGTPDIPLWSYFDWGSTVSPSWQEDGQNVYDIKVPVVIRDSQALGSNGHIHTFRFSGWTNGVTILDGPKGEPSQGGLPPTLRFKLDPVGTATAEYDRAGPKIDVLRTEVILSPDAQVIHMLADEADVATDLIRTSDVEALKYSGYFNITASNLNLSSLHIGYIGVNIRPDQTYKTITNPDAAFVLSDVNFRHALFHTYNQEEIISPLYGYIVEPIQSLVPPSQEGWANPDIPTHPFNPGDKTLYTNMKDGDPTNPYVNRYPRDHSAAGILRYGGYVYSPAIDNWVTPYDLDGDTTPGTTSVCQQDFDNYITDSDDVVPILKLWTPTYEVAPTSAEHGYQFERDLNDVGLTSIVQQTLELLPYLENVFELADFDMYMGFQRLGRFPDHLYYMCHSSQDVLQIPGAFNAPGCNDPELDAAVEIVETSLNHTEKAQAAYKAQNMLYNESYPDAAFSYMPLYSRIYFDAFNSDLRGIEYPPAGYGSNNPWTFLNIRWEPGTERYTDDGRTLLRWILCHEPELLNPTSASTVYAWLIMDRIVDGLISMTAFGRPGRPGQLIAYPTFENMPWLATNWSIAEWPGQGPEGESYMNVTFTLRKDLFWQDGNPYTAWDAEFNWMFLKNNQIPKYTSMTKFISDIDITDDYTATVILNTTSQFLLYDLAATAALLPPPVWSRLDGRPLEEILLYDPATNTTAPTGAGPWFGDVALGPTTQLYGTGAFVFDYYDPYPGYMVGEIHQNPHYFQFTDDVHGQKVKTFHDMGDGGSNPMAGPWNQPDGYIDVWDITYLTFNFGYFWFEPPANHMNRTEPGYRDYLDMNNDGIIDILDISMAAYHLDWVRDRYADLVSLARTRFEHI